MLDDLRRLEEQVGLADHLMRAKRQRSQEESAAKMQACHEHWKTHYLSTRAQNLLWEIQVFSLEELTLKTRSELLSIEGVGIKTVREIEEVMSRNCYSLSEHPCRKKSPPPPPAWYEFCL